VGATAFTLLSGEFVHGRPDGTATMILAAVQHARPLATVLPQVPTKVAEIIDVALSFDIAKRWPSAKMMQQALRASYPYIVQPPALVPVDATGAVPSVVPTAPTLAGDPKK
jgi:hypothetical protein